MFGGMRARTERRKRTAQCPDCGEYFSPQGLSGHLRFKHDMEARDVKQAVEDAGVAGGIRERTDATMGFIRQLQEIRAERDKLTQQVDAFIADTDGLLDDCVEALDAQELDVRNQLRKQQGKEPLASRARGLLAELTDEFFAGEEKELVQEVMQDGLDAVADHEREHPRGDAA